MLPAIRRENLSNLKIFINYILTIILSLPHLVFGQEVYPVMFELSNDKYYPENIIIKKNKIKYIIDSSEFIMPSNFIVKAYDTLGRIIGNFGYEKQKFENPYIYKNLEDTLIRIKRIEDSEELYSFEKFVYNKKGQIISYLECCNYYGDKNNIPITYEEFYYDEKFTLETKLCYYKRNFSGSINERIIFKPTDLELTDVVYYSYRKNKIGNLMIIGKHSIGKKEWRETDTTLFDNRNRIIKFNSFASMASLGCPVGNNVNRVTEYFYSDSSLLISNYTTHCLASLSNFKCLQYERIEDSKSETIFDKKNLKIRRYSITQSRVKELSDVYKYEYYK